MTHTNQESAKFNLIQISDTQKLNQQGSFCDTTKRSFLILLLQILAWISILICRSTDKSITCNLFSSCVDTGSDLTIWLVFFFTTVIHTPVSSTRTHMEHARAFTPRSSSLYTHFSRSRHTNVSPILNRQLSIFYALFNVNYGFFITHARSYENITTRELPVFVGINPNIAAGKAKDCISLPFSKW